MKKLFLLPLSFLLFGCGEKEDEDTEEEIDPADLDEDGDGFSIKDGDCNDSDGDVYPGATEYCGSVDYNCNGVIGNEDYDASDKATWYADTDGDGYGAGSSTHSCNKPTGHYVQNNDDCNNSDSSVHPGATEDLCNDVDDDCSGSPQYNTSTNFYLHVIDASFPCAEQVPNVSENWTSCDWDSNSFGGQDPDGYIKVTYPSGSSYSRVIENNTDPEFDEWFVFELNSPSDELGIFLYDEDDFQADEFGYGKRYNLSEVRRFADCGSTEFRTNDWGGWHISFAIESF